LLDELPAKMRSVTRVCDLFGNKARTTTEPDLKDVKTVVLQLLAAGIVDTSFTVDEKGEVSIYCMKAENKNFMPLHCDPKYWKRINH